MSDKCGSRGAGVVLGVCLFVVGAACRGQAAGAVPADQAQAAVGLVTKLYTVNPMAKADKDGKPLSKHGTWGVRPAKAQERVVGCDAEGAACDEVVYRAGQPEVACSWTVLFPAAGDAPTVVSDDEASAKYMLRKFTMHDKDRPADQTHVPPEVPPIARVAHISGNVLLTAVVDTSGKVIGVFVEQSTNPMFNKSAIDAVNNWQMTPYVLNGQPRQYEQNVLVTFI